MGSAKIIGKTIGEVEKITGIPKRKLKYMMERNLMHPSQRAENGFWLYSDEDIQIVRNITLLQQLGYTEKSIRKLISSPALQWSDALEQQILQLMARRNHIEDQLFHAELVRYRNGIHMEVVMSPSVEGSNPSAWKIGEKKALCRFLCQVFSEANPGTPLYELSSQRGRSPDDPGVQDQTRRLCDQFRQYRSISSAQLLLTFRLTRTLSGLVPVLNALLCADGAVEFITAAVQYYCEHQ